MGLRINTNVASLNAALNLGKANNLLSKSLSRLSTGLKINSAADGPADLIISEKMRSQIRAISQATENTQSAISMLSTAEGALNEVNALLVKVQGLALKAAQSGTQDPDQVAASQAEIDAALQSINSIARNTSFGSKFLLDGSLDIATDSLSTKDVTVDIERATFAGSSKNLNVEVIKAAEKATNYVNLNATGALDASQTIKVTGNRGSSTITFAAGATGEDIAKEINDQTTQTGVEAKYDSTRKRMEMTSSSYGSSQYVQIDDVDGTNDLLKGDLTETKRAASLEYGNQFRFVAKNAGSAGNNIAFQIAEGTTSTVLTGATALAISQDVSAGTTSVTITLQDTAVTSNHIQTDSAATQEGEKTVVTTIGELRSWIESNATLNALVGVELNDGASFSDVMKFDQTYIREPIKLEGGSDGLAATAATLTIAGSGTGTNAGKMTLTAKTAGVGGNDMNVIFATSSQMATYAYDETGIQMTTAKNNANYFTATSGQSIFFNRNTNTLVINSSATTQQISDSIARDAFAADAIEVSYTGPSQTLNATAVTKAYKMTGGAGVTGGSKGGAFIALNNQSVGLQAYAKESGEAGNGVELVLRNRGATAASVEVVNGNKVVVNLATGGAAGASASLSAFSTSDSSTLYITANAKGAFFNQFKFSVTDTGSGSNLASLSYDSTTKTVGISMDLGVVTVSELKAKFAASDLKLDPETNLTLADAFTITGGSAADTINVTTSAFATSTGGALVSGAYSGWGGASGMGVDNDVTTTLGSLITLVRQDATARNLVDLEFAAKGSALSYADVITVDSLTLSTATGADRFANAVAVFGDIGFMMAGGVDGDVQTNSVRKVGVDGQVKVNGVDASANELEFTFDNGDVRGTVTLAEGFNKTGKDTTFNISSKGAFFQIGQKGQLSYQTGIALRNISANALGTGQYLNPDYNTTIGQVSGNDRKVVATLADIASGGKFDLTKGPSTAVEVIEAAIKDVSTLRGQIGAFVSNTLESNLNSLGVAFENLTASESRIRDVDFAQETSEFTRAQILVQAGTSVAAQANVATQAALQLLG